MENLCPNRILSSLRAFRSTSNLLSVDPKMNPFWTEMLKNSTLATLCTRTQLCTQCLPSPSLSQDSTRSNSISIQRCGQYHRFPVLSVLSSDGPKLLQILATNSAYNSYAIGKMPMCACMGSALAAACTAWFILFGPAIQIFSGNLVCS